MSCKCAKRREVELAVGFTTPLVIEHRIVYPPPEPEPEAGASATVTVKVGGFTVKSEGLHVMYTLPDNMQVNVQVTFVDAKGHPATIDGPVVWKTSDENILTVSVMATDGSEANLMPGTNLGTAQITATADADLGEGVRPVICVLDVDVVGGEAVTGTITPVGSPEPIPVE